jgi:hypothetical protein
LAQKLPGPALSLEISQNATDRTDGLTSPEDIKPFIWCTENLVSQAHFLPSVSFEPEACPGSIETWLNVCGCGALVPFAPIAPSPAARTSPSSMERGSAGRSITFPGCPKATLTSSQGWRFATQWSFRLGFNSAGLGVSPGPMNGNGTRMCCLKLLGSVLRPSRYANFKRTTLRADQNVPDFPRSSSMTSIRSLGQPNKAARSTSRYCSSVLS